jgi:acyl-CoA thioester hydrolase
MSSAMGEPFVYPLRVRYGDCDPQGIVFNPNYLSYFDIAFMELWRAASLPWNEVNDRGVDAVLAEVGIRFRAPARFDEMIDLRTLVTKLGTTSMTLTVDAMSDERLLVEGNLRYVFVDGRTWEKIEIPEFARTALAPFTRE